MSSGGRKITLYGPAEIPFTEKVRRALLYKGLEFELEEPSGPEDYRRWNPESGLLPVLEIDGEIYPDSTFILFKLDEIFPDPPLLSSDPRISGQQKQLEDWADENLLWYFNKWLRSKEAEGDAATPDASGGGLVRRYAPLRRFLAWLRAGGTWERPEIAMMLYSMSLETIPGSEKLIMDRPPLVEFMRRVEAATGDLRDSP
jgi:glutathione S-transferase